MQFGRATGPELRPRSAALRRLPLRAAIHLSSAESMLPALLALGNKGPSRPASHLQPASSWSGPVPPWTDAARVRAERLSRTQQASSVGRSGPWPKCAAGGCWRSRGEARTGGVPGGVTVGETLVLTSDLDSGSTAALHHPACCVLTTGVDAATRLAHDGPAPRNASKTAIMDASAGCNAAHGRLQSSTTSTSARKCGLPATRRPISVSADVSARICASSMMHLPHVRAPSTLMSPRQLTSAGGRAAWKADGGRGIGTEGGRSAGGPPPRSLRLKDRRVR